MVTVLYWIAGIFTVLFFLRLILMLVGLDGSDAADAVDAADAADALDAVDAHDIVDAAHSAADIADFKIVSLQTLLVTLMVGSWVALLCIDGYRMNEVLGLVIGGGVGFVSGVGVSYGLWSMRKLQHDGTVRNFDPVGLRGTCYLRVPEAGEGKGQVQVVVQGRLCIFDAVSDGPAIDSFRKIVVMSRVDANTLRVCETE